MINIIQDKQVRAACDPFIFRRLPANSNGCSASLGQGTGAGTPRAVPAVGPQGVRVVRQVVALLRKPIRSGQPTRIVVVAVDAAAAIAARLEGQPLHACAGVGQVEGQLGRPSRQELDLVSGAGDERHSQAAVEVVGSSLVDLEDAIERLKKKR